jgi:hypothetical protein
LGQAVASALPALEGTVYSQEREAATFTIVVTSNLACTLEILFRDDFGVDTIMQSQSVLANEAEMFVFPGNVKEWRPRLTRVGASAWNAQIYGAGA